MRFILFKVLLIYCTDKCTEQLHCGITSKDELPKSRGSLANDITSCVIEQANQEVQKVNHHSQHASNQASPQTHSNFCTFKFCVLFNFVYQIIYEIKSLQNFTLRHIFSYEIFQIYSSTNAISMAI